MHQLKINKQDDINKSKEITFVIVSLLSFKHVWIQLVTLTYRHIAQAEHQRQQNSVLPTVIPTVR